MSKPMPNGAPCRALLLCLVLAAIPLPARADGDLTDRLAISFSSQYAYHYCVFASPFTPLTMYVMLSEPSFAELHGWEAAIRLHDGRAPFLVSATVGLGGQNTGTWPEFAVTFPEPVPTSELMLLATVTMLPASWAECLVLTGLRVPSLPDQWPLVWPAAGASMEITRSAIWPNGVAAATGGCAPIPEATDYCAMVVANEPVSWGAFKARYR